LNLYEFAPVGYLTLNQVGIIKEANLSGAKLLGVERNKLLHRRFVTFVCSDEIDLWYLRFQGMLKRDEHQSFKLMLNRAEGSKLPVQIDWLRFKRQSTSSVRIAFTDISKSMQIEEQQRWTTDESFRLMVESVNDYAIIMLDTDGYVVSWNCGAQRIKGYTSKEIIGQHFSRFYPKEDIAQGKPQKELDVVIANGRFEDEGWRVRKDGSAFWANVIITAVMNQDGSLRGFAKLTRDITERKPAESRIGFLANHDRLTGLPNRELFYDRLSQSISHARRNNLSLVVLFLDLDGFKSINDNYGHEAGDVVLKIVAKRLQMCSRDMDTVSRLGGR
jgi:PAS domain S-box-containing protein